MSRPDPIKRKYLIRPVVEQNGPALAQTPADSLPAQAVDVAPEALSHKSLHEMIAEAAYYRAARRSFRGGSPEQDWFAAEAEIRELLRRAASHR